ncbi:MAG: AURKAIP1/COX24 domain-containing protein [Dehalococcoidia bacterium]|nr:AURKAIP1/COX24 domain-containing protein [Dehalococcoidia bacterium]
MGNVLKKKRKKIARHKQRKVLKKTRWQRRHP